MPRRYADSVRRLLIIAAKVPQAGRVKTRLVSQSSGVSEQEAAHLAQAFLRDTVEKAVHPFVPADVWLAVDGDAGELPDDLKSGSFRVVPQEGRELGERLTRLFEQGFAANYDQIVIVGSDTPHLPPAFLVDAWGRLKISETDIVLGPAEDGGYYLIGLKAMQAGLFSGIAWSTGAVLGETRERARENNLVVTQTPPWYDIDTINDLRRLHTDLTRGVVSAPFTHAALAALFK